MDRCSLIGMVLFFGNCPISWSTKKQGTVSHSSTEAEYRALASTTVELYWIRMLLRDFGLFLPHPPLLWCDNVSALAIATNLVFHAHTKHIELDYHFVREKVLRHDLLIKFISTHDQLADLFTKGLPSPQFNWLTSKLMWKFPIRLRGDESHGSASSSGGPEDSNQEEEEEAPTATSNIKMLSCIRLRKHKATKRHHFSLKEMVPFCVCCNYFSLKGMVLFCVCAVMLLTVSLLFLVLYVCESVIACVRQLPISLMLSLLLCMYVYIDRYLHCKCI